MSKWLYLLSLGVIGTFGSELVIADPAENTGSGPGSQTVLVLPNALPPQFGLAVIREKGEIEIRYLESVPVWVTETKETPRKVGDLLAVDTKSYQVCHHVPRTVATRRAAGEYRVFRSGKPLDEKTLAVSLKEPVRVVFVEVSGQESPDGFFLSRLKDDTLVVALHPLKRSGENAATPTTPRDHVAPREEAAPTARPATVVPNLDSNKLGMIIGPESDPWNPVLMSCDGVLYFESNLKANAGLRSIAPAKECCRMFELNNGTLRLYGDFGEKGVAKAGAKCGWYLTADYSTNPPGVILAEKPTKHSRWTITRIGVESAYIKNENPSGKDAWLSMEKEGVKTKADGADSVWLRRPILSFSEKDKLSYRVAAYDPNEK